MVRGNKFKPGEPPKKKQRLAEPDQNQVHVEPSERSQAQATVDHQLLNDLPQPKSQKLHKRKNGPPTAGDDQMADNPNVPNSKRQKLLKLQSTAPRLEPQAGKGPSDPDDKAENKAPLPGDQPKPVVSYSKKANARRKARRKQRLLHLKAQAAEKAQNPDDTHKKSGTHQLEQTLNRVKSSETDTAESTDDKAGAKTKTGSFPGKHKGVSNLSSAKQIALQEHAEKIGKPDLFSKIHTNIATPKQGGNASSNWANIKQLIGSKPKKDVHLKGDTPAEAGASKKPESKGKSTEITPIVAVDCEMVGVGPDGSRSSLARVCIVNDQGNVLMDKFVRQKEKTTDYRTKFSGIRPKDVADENAEPFEDIQKEAAAIFKGRIIVGHAIHNDLRALMLGHPNKMIRDTAKFRPLMRPGGPGRKPKPKALRHLAYEELGLGIQSGEHSPVEDARAALYLYQRHAKEWERHLKLNTLHKLQVPMGKRKQGQQNSRMAQKTLAELAAQDEMADL